MAENTTSSAPELTIRTHRPGDIGLIVHRHGFLYHREYDWGTRFEALIAHICASFLDTHDPAKEACFIAEHNGIFAGCVMLVKDPTSSESATTSTAPEMRVENKVAKLRLLLVEPEARGLGVGGKLVRTAVDFARTSGYERIFLWTQKVLVGARRIYERMGFRCVGESEHESFGHPLVGETWVLDLGSKEDGGEEQAE